MSTQTDYNAQQWKAIVAAPTAAGLYITLADASGVVGLTKEAMAVGKAITDAAASGAPDVVKSLAESVKAAGGRPEMPDYPKGDRGQMKATLITAIKDAVTAVESKSPLEATAYKSWLVSVASNVAHASKEGGFLGIGGTVVSKEEKEALKTLADALGVAPPTLPA
jgi:hypothetical protein